MWCSQCYDFDLNTANEALNSNNKKRKGSKNSQNVGTSGILIGPDSHLGPIISPNTEVIKGGR